MQVANRYRPARLFKVGLSYNNCYYNAIYKNNNNNLYIYIYIYIVCEFVYIYHMFVHVFLYYIFI